jgi:RNA ligase
VPLHIDTLLDGALLEAMIAERYVKVVHHPTLPLRILNYTARAQFDAVWNDVTVSCRGLIIDENGVIVARPFRKFFNYAQHDAGSLPSGPVHVTEKLDGSLGILYPTPDGYAVATRGRFHSEQALHATALWEERYAEHTKLDPALTYLVEIVYPENRIVVDYDELDDLVLLAALDTESGRTMPFETASASWPGPCATEHSFSSLAEVLAASPAKNTEGFVVHFVDDDLRMKVKHDEYVRLHRIVTDVSERRVWEALSEGLDLSEWLEGVPDELYAFVATTRDALLAAFSSLTEEMRAHHQELVASLPSEFSRRDFAAGVTALSASYPLAKGLFALHDGKDVSHLVWEKLRPAEHIPFFQASPDTE